MKKYIRLTILFLIAGVNLAAQVKRVECVGMTVSDMDRSVSFYQQVLGFKKISDTELSGEVYEQLNNLFGLRMRVVRLSLGDEEIELTDYLTSGGRSIPEDAKSNDLSFQHIAIVVSDMEKAYSQLRKFNVSHISTSPQTLPPSIPEAAGIKAFYFRDPDGHSLELIFFPPGKGLAKWHQANDNLFLGIDHTAIGVSNTDSSLRFYQRLLGLERKGESFNTGNEQSHLNYVEDASLHITGLRSQQGPGVEFLEYLRPGAGKRYPADSKTDDIWHWQTTVVVENIEKLFETSRTSGYRQISKKIVQIKNMDGSRAMCFLVRDPDGHAVLFKENIK